MISIIIPHENGSCIVGDVLRTLNVKMWRAINPDVFADTPRRD